METLVFCDRDISESYAKVKKIRLKTIFEYGMREIDLSTKAVEIYQEALSLSPHSNFLFTTPTIPQFN